MAVLKRPAKAVVIREADRMTCSFGHDAMKPSKQNALAVVDPVSSVCRLYSDMAVSLPVPADSFAPLLVEKVSAVINIAKIADPVVLPVSVDMINHVRLLSAGDKPSNSVGKVKLPIVRKSYISGASSVSRLLSDLGLKSICLPRKISSAGVVMKDISYGVWNNLCSHVELPLSVVRGAVVGATVAPILTWEMSLAK